MTPSNVLAPRTLAQLEELKNVRVHEGGIFIHEEDSRPSKEEWQRIAAENSEVRGYGLRRIETTPAHCRFQCKTQRSCSFDMIVRRPSGSPLFYCTRFVPHDESVHVDEPQGSVPCAYTPEMLAALPCMQDLNASNAPGKFGLYCKNGFRPTLMRKVLDIIKKQQQQQQQQLELVDLPPIPSVPPTPTPTPAEEKEDSNHGGDEDLLNDDDDDDDDDDLHEDGDIIYDSNYNAVGITGTNVSVGPPPPFVPEEEKEGEALASPTLSVTPVVEDSVEDDVEDNVEDNAVDDTNIAVSEPELALIGPIRPFSYYTPNLTRTVEMIFNDIERTMASWRVRYEALRRTERDLRYLRAREKLAQASVPERLIGIPAPTPTPEEKEEEEEEPTPVLAAEEEPSSRKKKRRRRTVAETLAFDQAGNYWN